MNSPSSNGTGQQLLTPQEAADLLRVRVSWIYNHSRRRSHQPIPCLKLGKYLRFRSSELMRWVEEQGRRHDLTA